MDIFSYFRRKRIDTLDATFYRKIEEWKSWYNGNVRNFSFYRVYTGQGSYTKRKRKTMGMAKKVCEDIADLLLNERVKFVFSDDATGAFVQEVLDENQFLVFGNDYQERKAYTGTVAYIPYTMAQVLNRHRPDAFQITAFADNTSFPVSRHYRLGG